MKKINNKGFTLVELLATIAVLAVVISFVVYVALNVVDNSKDKSYKVTINNIQANANNYILEELSSSTWVNVSGLENKYEYQCVSVGNLIDAGYFKSDVLDSYVTEDRKVLSSDNIYLERSKDTKTITSSKLIYEADYEGLCLDFNVVGKIDVEVNPFGWATSKDIKIDYTLYNVDAKDVFLYKHDYAFASPDRNMQEVSNFEGNVVQNNVSTDSAGTLVATIKDSENHIIVSKTIYVDKIDRIKPMGTITATNRVESKQDVTLRMWDNESYVKDYYFGLDNPEEKDVSWIDVSTASEKVLSTVVNVEGTYYLGIRDAVNNMYVTSISFAKTILNINNGSVVPKNIITKIGNSFKIPTPEMDEYYQFGGWYNNSSFSDVKLSNYTPANQVNHLYGKDVEDRPDEFTVVYKSNDGSNRVTSAICIEGEECSISSSGFTRTGYTFLGWTTKSDGTDDGYNWTGWNGTWNYKNGQRGISNYKLVLYARWKVNKVKIKFSVNGGTIKGSAGGYSWTTDSSGIIKKDETIFWQTIDYGSIIGDSGLPNWNNSDYIYVTKDNKWVKSGEEWKCISGCTDSTSVYNHKNESYESFDFCDASNGDCTVVLGVNWKDYHNVKIRYSVNGGEVTPVTYSSGGTKYNWTTDSDGVVKLNGSYLEYTINYQQTIGDKYSSGLANLDNSSYLNITNVGKYVITNNEWICLDGYECDGTIFSDSSTTIKASEFCDATEADCTVVLGANWNNNHQVHIKYSSGHSDARIESYEQSFSTNGDENMILYDGEEYVQSYYYGTTIDPVNGLVDWNNNTWIYINYPGHNIQSGSEWKCKSGCKNPSAIYSDDTIYSASDFCDASTSDCTVILEPNWKTNKVKIKFSVNGGTIKGSAGGYSWTTDGSGIIKKDETIFWQTIDYGSIIGDSGLPNWNNSDYIYVTKDNKWVKSGEEWKCISGCTDSTSVYNHKNESYESFDFCDASTSDCTVVLGVNWKDYHNVIIKYAVNGGTIASETTTSAGNKYTWSTDSSGTIKRNGTIYTEKYAGGGTLSDSGLSNWDNSEFIKITKTGHLAKSGEEWKCKSGCSNSSSTYSDQTIYKSSDFCSAKTADCTVILEVNWGSNLYTITYNANGGFSDTATGDSACSSDKTGNHDVTGTMENTTCTYGSYCTLRPNAFSRQCHTFRGWTTKTDTDSTDYTDSITNATSANGTNFFVDSDGFTYDKTGNITLYAVWESNHNFKGIGNHLVKTQGMFTCGKTHTLGYNIYCTKCGMSAAHYNHCYKLGYETAESTRFCPNGVDDAIKTFDDRSYWNFTSGSDPMSNSKANSFAGTYEGGSGMSVACNYNCAAVVKNGH